MEELISNKKMAYAEEAINFLAKALDVDEKEVVGILEDGLFFRRCNKLSDKEKYLMEELKSTFDCL